MPDQDDILKAIESVYSAALAPEEWPRVLKDMAELVGGIAGCIELVDKRTMRHRWLRVCRLPPAEELRYSDQYLPLSPRVALGMRQREGELSYDSMLLSEAEITRDPFYADFLPQTGFRYYVGGVLTQTEDVMGAFSIQRTPAQGHVGRAEIELMAILLPHVARAVDLTLRCEAIRGRERALDSALDWLGDGALLLRADGSVAFANEAARALLAAGDGLRIAGGRMECESRKAGAALAAAVAAALRVASGETVDGMADVDCPVPRPSGAPPYLVSVRPLAAWKERWTQLDGAALIAFIRDPAATGCTSGALIRELFGLTEAETALALALQAGCAPPDYARRHGLSLNTVYTHLRRLREKTGCVRQAALVRLLDDLRLPAPATD